MTIAEPRAADPGAAPGPAEPDMSALFGELADDAKIMLDRDLAMARAELRLAARQARTAGVGFGTAALVGYLALGVLSVAAALGLSEVMAPALAFLVVGLVLAGVAGAAVTVARKNLDALDPVPHETLDTIKEDLAWLRTDDLIDITQDEDRHEVRLRSSRRGRGRGSDPADDDRGRDADRPGDVPASGWKDVALRVKGEVKEDQVPLLSAGVAFYLLLALFPALAALVSLYGLFADPAQVSQQVGDLTGTLPQEAQSLITDQLEKVTEEEQGIGVTLAVSIAAALWAASSGVKHLIGAVNAAYDERETREFLKLRGLSLGLTVGAVLFATISLGVIAVLPALAEELPFGEVGQTLVQIGSYVGLAVGFALGLAVLYRYAPDRDAPKWRWVSWGAAIATAVWILGSVAFSVYVSNFGSYGETYGSIGAVIVLMLWLAVTAFAIILGAEVNSELEAQTAKDSTVGHPEPMGTRGAVKADNIGEPAAT